MHQVVRYLARYAPQQPWLTVGQVVDLTQYVTGGVEDAFTTDRGTQISVIVESPAGNREVRQVGASAEYLALTEHGFYEIRHMEDSDVIGTVAVNVDVTESDLTRLEPEEWASSVTYRGAGRSTAGLAATLTPGEKERRQGLWWYLLVAVLLVLVAESAISNRVSHKTA
jgi:hypothetical protein